MVASDYSDVFVSYRRVDVDFTKKIVQALQDAGKEVWIDWEDIAPGSTGFSDDIKRGLEGADAFLCILSPSYLESSYCIDLELAYAIKLNKKIIPIVLEKFPDADIPVGIGHINWIYSMPHAGQANTFDDVIASVLTALELDIEHGRAHKRILLRALDWDNNARENSFLLTGAEIAEAESWLANASDKDPAPLDLHREYIAASRAQAIHRQQRILAGVSVALVVSLALSILSFLLYGQAEANRIIADDNASTAIAAEATAQQQADESYALASALRAIDILNTDPFLAYALVIDALQSMPRVDTFIQRTARNILLETGARYSILPERDGIEIYSIDATGRYALVSQDDDRDDVIPTKTIWVYDLVERMPIHDLNISNDGLFGGAIQNGIVAFPLIDLATYLDDTDNVIAFQRVDETQPFWQVSLQALGYAEDSMLDTLVLSPDGTHIALYYMDNSDGTHHALVIDIMNQTEVFSMEFEDEVADFAFSDDNRILALSDFSTVWVYDLTTGERISDPINFTFTDRLVTALDISDDGTMLAAGGLVPSIIIWDIAGNRALANLSGHDNIVTSVKFAPGSKFLLSGGSDRQLILWDIAREQQLASYPYHEDVLVTVGVYPDGFNNKLYAMTINGIYTQWQANADSASIRLSEFGGVTVSFDDTGENILYSTLDLNNGDHQFISRNLATGEDTPLFVIPIDNVNNLLRFAPYLSNTRAIFIEYFVTEGLYSFPQVIDLTTAETLAELDIEGWAESIQVSDDGTRVLFSNDQMLTAELWDLTTYEQLAVYSGISSVAFYPDSNRFLMGRATQDDVLLMTEYDEQGEPLRDIIVDAEDIFITAIDIHPDGNQALIGTLANTLYQIDLSANLDENVNDRIMNQYEAHTAQVTNLEYSQDGSRFFSTAQDDRAILWDIASGQILRTFKVGVSANSVQFSPQDAMLAISSATDQVIIWRLYEDADLIAWAYDNLQVPLITCEQRINFKIAPQCNDDGTIPATPTLAPTKVVAVSTIVPAYATPLVNTGYVLDSDIPDDANMEGIDADNYLVEGIELYTEAEDATIYVTDGVLGINSGTLRFNTLDIWQVDAPDLPTDRVTVTLEADALADSLANNDYVGIALDVIGGGELLYSEFTDTDLLDDGRLQLTWQIEEGDITDIETLYFIVSGSMDDIEALYPYTLTLE